MTSKTLVKVIRIHAATTIDEFVMSLLGHPKCDLLKYVGYKFVSLHYVDGLLHRSKFFIEEFNECTHRKFAEYRFVYL